MLAQVFRSEPGWQLAAANRSGAGLQACGRPGDASPPHRTKIQLRLNADPAVMALLRAYAGSTKTSNFCWTGIRCFGTAVVPRPPLGIVIWIDNQFAAFDPQAGSPGDSKRAMATAAAWRSATCGSKWANQRASGASHRGPVPGDQVGSDRNDVQDGIQDQAQDQQAAELAIVHKRDG